MNSKLLIHRVILISPLILFLSILFYIPLLNLFYTYLIPPGSSFNEVFSNPLLVRFTIFTFTQALFTVLGSALLGIPAGYLLARTRPYSSSLLRALITVPFIFPPLAILIGFVVFYEPNGFLGSIFGNQYDFTPFSFWGIVLAHMTYNVPIFVRLSESAFQFESRDLHDLADTMGFSRWQKFKLITLPQITPSMQSAALLVFLYAFNSFAIVLILGEIKLQTIEVMIYYQSRIRFKLSRAAVLALFQLIINFIIIYIYLIKNKRNHNTSSEWQFGRSNQRNWSTILLLIIISFEWIPIILVFKTTINQYLIAPQSLKSRLFSLDYDPILGTNIPRIFINTMFFASITSIVSVVMSLMMLFYLRSIIHSTLQEKLISLLIILPMGTSAVTVSFAILVYFGTSIIFNEYIWLFIISAHLIAALPFTYRTLSNSLDAIPEDLIIISKTLGSSNYNTFKTVIFPYLKNSILISLLFAFAISFGEFGATFYLARGEWTTLSLAINRLFSTRSALLPNLFASLLILIALFLFWIIEKLGSLELKI